ncbi:MULTISPECIES: FUSC family protein [Paenibacillus]|uniref:FUSC family protein n=1 Tax=Paenibacillus TaxID=44249 RepID=UPI00203BA3F0|nr:FUSC family protein [Paenibacillus illinoisensis]MCM3203540.1 FUSC family protein [Paenibacillus illinoisensis]
MDHTQFTHDNRRRPKHPFPKKATYREAFRIKPIPLNWFKGIGSAISVGIPSLIGFLIGDPALGILASVGGFTFLYVSNEPYSQRAVRLFWIALGLTASFALGALSSYNDVLMVLMFGVVGFLSTMLFKLFEIAGPGGLFIVLAYAIGTSMPHEPAVLGSKVLCVLLGAIFAWIVAMTGVLVNPHRNENKAVSAVYQSLASLLSSIGMDTYAERQHQTAFLIKQAERTLSHAKLFGERNRNNDVLAKLIRLNVQAEAIFLSILDVSQEKKHEMEDQLAESLLTMSNQLHDNDKEKHVNIQISEEGSSTFLRNLYADVMFAYEIHSGTVDLSPAPASSGAEEKKNVSGTDLFKKLFRDSPIPFIALRYGTIIFISAAIAYGFHLNRSYWVPLSSAAVMGGGTYVSNLHRGIQRSVGTIIGIWIGAALLWLKPAGLFVSLTLAGLQFIVELIYARNYSLAVMFITPSTLLIGTTINPALTSGYFISARLVDIIIGSIVAIVGTALLWRKISSKRLLTVFSDAVEKEGEVLISMLESEHTPIQASKQQELQQALLQLRIVYDNALAESLRRDVKVASLWPAVGDCLHLGYMLLAAYRHPSREVAEERVHEYKVYFERLRHSFKDNENLCIDVPDVPSLPEYPLIHEDLARLHDSIRNEAIKKGMELHG